MEKLGNDVDGVLKLWGCFVERGDGDNVEDTLLVVVWAKHEDQQKGLIEYLFDLLDDPPWRALLVEFNKGLQVSCVGVFMGTRKPSHPTGILVQPIKFQV